MTITTVELLACPFCASKDVELRESITDEMIACNNCGCRTGFIYLGASDASNAAKRRELIAIWNTRTEPTLISNLVKALEFYANPEIYRPHPHGPAFDRRDLSFVAKEALRSNLDKEEGDNG